MHGSAEVFWWDAPEGEVNKHVLEHVTSVDYAQADVFERFLRLACLYDPNERMGISSAIDWRGAEFNVQENVCASNVDTVAALVSRNEVGFKFKTDEGDWSAQRKAKHLEWYSDAMLELYEVHPLSRRGFKDAAIFGMGIAKIGIEGPEGDEEIVVERVLCDEIVVDEAECRISKVPRQMHQRRMVDRDLLKAQYPDQAEDIDKAWINDTQSGGAYRLWANYRPMERNEIGVVESWRLPYGKPGSKRYVPGRHTICVQGLDLFDEEYHESHFPFAVFYWNERTTGYYGRGLVEDVAGLQRALNKLNWQIDRAIDHYAVPTTYVRPADAHLKAEVKSRIGSVAVVKGDYPVTVVPQAVGSEAFGQRQYIKESASEFGGVSRLAQHGTKPVGLESAPALREYRDATTERFAIQEKNYEQFVKDIMYRILACCKKLGKSAPKVIKKTRFGEKQIIWKDVDLGELKVQMTASNPLSKTQAGRTQTVIEWMNAGVITQEEGRRLLKHPDLERAISLYTAGLEDIERTIEEILDGEYAVPEPFQNLKMGVWRLQQAYLKAKGDGAPEEILDALSTWIEQAAWLLMQQEKAEASLEQAKGPMPPTPDMMMMMDPSAGGGAPPMPGAPPGMPPGMPPMPPGAGPMPPGPPPPTGLPPGGGPPPGGAPPPPM